jgi:hypothetical protein
MPSPRRDAEATSDDDSGVRTLTCPCPICASVYPQTSVCCIPLGYPQEEQRGSTRRRRRGAIGTPAHLGHPTTSRPNTPSTIKLKFEMLSARPYQLPRSHRASTVDRGRERPRRDRDGLERARRGGRLVARPRGGGSASAPRRRRDKELAWVHAWREAVCAEASWWEGVRPRLRCHCHLRQTSARPVSWPACAVAGSAHWLIIHRS